LHDSSLITHYSSLITAILLSPSPENEEQHSDKQYEPKQSAGPKEPAAATATRKAATNDAGGLRQRH